MVIVRDLPPPSEMEVLANQGEPMRNVVWPTIG